MVETTEFERSQDEGYYISSNAPASGEFVKKSDFVLIVTRQQSAIEHGIYLAYAAERFMAAVDNLDRVYLDEESDQHDLEDSEQAKSECLAALELSIHEFKKRA